MLLFCAGTFLQACMDALAKWLGEDYTVWQVMAFRMGFGLLPAFLMLALRGQPLVPAMHRPLGHLWRGLFTAGAGLSFFYSLQFMSLAEATAVFYVAPIIMYLFGFVFLRETGGWVLALSVVFGFAGTLIIYAPWSAPVGLGPAMALIGAVFYALSMVQIRKLAQTESSEAILLYGTIVSMVVALFGAPFGWIAPSLPDLGLFLAMGLCGGFSIFFFASALRYLSVVQAANLEYTAIIWAILIGFLVWQAVPDLRTGTGAALITLAGVVAAIRMERDRAGSAGD
ncbi:MAG: DMT family transporter [Pseudomonadota bacterium]